MRNLSNTIKTLLLSTVLIMASCQKDYYLEDLNEANQTIEELEITIQTLLAQGDVDAKEINKLQEEVEALHVEVGNLMNELMEQGLINEALTLEISELKAKIEVYQDNCAALENEITQLQNDLTSKDITISEYITLISDLEDDLAFEKNNIKTIIEYVQVEVERVVTQTQVVHVIEEVIVVEEVEVIVEVENQVEVEVEEIAIPAVEEEEEAVVIAEPVITQDITQQLADTVLESELGELSFVYTNNDDDDIDLVDIIETITITYTDGVLTSTDIQFTFVLNLDNTPEVVVEVVEEVEVNNSLFDTAFGEGAWGIVIDPYGNGGKKTLGDVIVNDQQTTYNVVMDMTDYGFLNTPSKSGKYTKAFQSATLYISFDKNSSVIDIELILNENFGGNASPSVNVSHFFN